MAARGNARGARAPGAATQSDGVRSRVSIPPRVRTTSLTRVGTRGPSGINTLSPPVRWHTVLHGSYRADNDSATMTEATLIMMTSHTARTTTPPYRLGLGDAFERCVVNLRRRPFS